jgi:RNA polymerase sigma factor (sigma-70 family)
MQLSNKELVQQAKGGNKNALETIVQRIQNKIYNLALRMLYNPADAEDATQEILIRVITHLSRFRAESAFTTWAYRVAANYLLTTRRRLAENTITSFDNSEALIARNSANTWRESESEAQQGLVVEEIMISCLQGLLLCLDREHRLAYILGEVFDVTGGQGAEILEISRAAFRKRLSRARTRLRDFMSKNCALINPANPCKCENQADRQIEIGFLDTQNLAFAAHPCRIKQDQSLKSRLQELDELNRVSTLFKSCIDVEAPGVFVENIRGILSSGQYEIFDI